MFFNIFIISIVQGITEFLPISSSGHLVLFHGLLDGVHDGYVSKITDIAVHVGTLLAVMLYFRTEVAQLFCGAFDVLKGRFKSANAQLLLKLAASSIPVFAVGLVVFLCDPSLFDSLWLVAIMTIVFGVVLYIADRKPMRMHKVENFTFKEAMVYGLMQCIALIPGVSRSGITMTAGRFMGHSREEAARFSLLMGMVAIAGAGLLAGLSLMKDANLDHDFLMVLAVGVACAFVTAYMAIFLMMRWVKRASFAPFVVYRIILGVGLLYALYSGIIPQNM